MNTQDTIEFATTPAAITKLVAVILAADSGAREGRATYLRSLLAATQTEIAGKPVLRVTGRAKRPSVDDALAAFERAQKPFYDAVLAAVPEGLSALERQSKTSFARSAAATLRRAISLGWNPLAHGVAKVTKGELTAWVATHAEPRPLTPKRAEKRVMNLVGRISEMLAVLPKEDSDRILAMATADLGISVPEPQRITGAKLVRHERRAAH